MKIFRLIRRVTQILKSKYRLSKYDNYTIAEYFREQGAQIGKDCFFSIRNIASEPYLVKVGDHVGIASGVILATHSLGWIFRDRIPDIQIFGKIEIGDNCNIGVNAIILPNVTIGKNCIVAAGAVVNKSVPDNSIVAGVPAKVIGNVEDYFKNARMIWEVQKPEGYMSELDPNIKYTPREFDVFRQLPKNKKLLKEHLIKIFWEEEKK